MILAVSAHFFGIHFLCQLFTKNKLTPHATVELQQRLSEGPLATVATFRSNALPAYVELELGVLEPYALRTYRQMVKDDLAPDVVRAYLERRINKVQIFRKRIPFRSVAQ